MHQWCVLVGRRSNMRAYVPDFTVKLTPSSIYGILTKSTFTLPSNPVVVTQVFVTTKLATWTIWIISKSYYSIGAKWVRCDWSCYVHCICVCEDCMTLLLCTYVAIVWLHAPSLYAYPARPTVVCARQVFRTLSSLTLVCACPVYVYSVLCVCMLVLQLYMSYS